MTWFQKMVAKWKGTVLAKYFAAPTDLMGASWSKADVDAAGFGAATYQPLRNAKRIRPAWVAVYSRVLREWITIAGAEPADLAIPPGSDVAIYWPAITTDQSPTTNDQ